jgi:hypothetical protein
MAQKRIAAGVDDTPPETGVERWWSYCADLGRFDLGAPLLASVRVAINGGWSRLDTLDVPIRERVELLVAFCARLGMPADRVRARTLVGAASARRRPADSPHAALDRRRAAEARRTSTTPKGRTDD